MHLSVRLKTIASFVTEGNILADIGTDHAYIPIYLVSKKIIPSAIAMDINKGPIIRAENNIKEAKIDNKIKTKISDGLSGLDIGQADTILIAGLGGLLMRKILLDFPQVVESARELVLSPHSEVDLIRKFLHNNNFNIIKETMLKDDGKYYVVIKAVKGYLNYDREIHYKYGRLLLENRNIVLYNYLIERELKLKKIIENLILLNTTKNKQKINELTEELNGIKEALNYYE